MQCVGALRGALRCVVQCVAALHGCDAWCVARVHYTVHYMKAGEGVLHCRCRAAAWGTWSQPGARGCSLGHVGLQASAASGTPPVNGGRRHPGCTRAPPRQLHDDLRAVRDEVEPGLRRGAPATLCAAGCNPVCCRLQPQPHVSQAAATALRPPGCSYSPTSPRLQPHVSQVLDFLPGNGPAQFAAKLAS